MLGKIVENNFLILGKDAGIYTKNPLREPIPIKGKFGMTLLIQKEGVFILGGANPKELVFEVFEIGSDKVKDLSPRLPSQRNPFPFFNILNMKQGKQNSYAWNNN